MTQPTADGFMSLWKQSSVSYRQSMITFMAANYPQLGPALLKRVTKAEILEAFSGSEEWCLAELAPTGIKNMKMFPGDASAAETPKKGKKGNGIPPSAAAAFVSDVVDAVFEDDEPEMSADEMRSLASLRAKLGAMTAKADLIPAPANTNIEDDVSQMRAG